MKRYLLLILMMASLAQADITIQNLGLTGFEQTHPEYTSVPSVQLIMDYAGQTDGCRFTNHDEDSLPTASDHWTPWESCVEERVWQLNDSFGLKRVFIAVNYSGTIAYYNDTIYYNYTGTGLDTTPPNPPYILDGDYTNDNTSFSFEWRNASDPESDILGIPLQYRYWIYVDDNTTMSLDPVLYLPFDENSNSTISMDASMYNNNATPAGAVYRPDAGIFKHAYETTAGGLSVTPQDEMRMTSELTISAWINRQSDGTAFIMAKEEGTNTRSYMIYELSAQINFFVTENGTVPPKDSNGRWPGLVAAYTFNAPKNEWHHIAGVHNDAGVHLYIDGNLMSSYTGVESIYDNPSTSFYVGQRYSGYEFSGYIDEVAVYDYALTQAQIEALYEAGRRQLASGTTTQTYTSTSGHNVAHNATVLVDMIVQNSAGLTSQSVSDGLIVDLVPPYMNSLEGSFLNASSGQHQAFLDEDFWVHSSRINLSWTAVDELSDNVTAYSYVLSDTPKYPDDIPEGEYFHNTTSVVLNNIDSGKYYFAVKPRDAAGNWGEPWYINISVDSSPASAPAVTSAQYVSGQYYVTWTDARDPHSGIQQYNVRLLNGTTLLRDNFTTDTAFYFSDVPSGTYNISVGAQNGVGLWSWSGRDQAITDADPPNIHVTPNVTVLTSPFKLRAWTDEDATCTYNTTSGPRTFSYTNTTYHETRLSAGTGTHSYNITCADTSGNKKSSIHSLTIASDTLTRIDAEPITAYENSLIEYSAYIQGSQGLSGVQDIRVSVDGETVDASVFDRGDGHYLITLEPMPAGSYVVDTISAGIANETTLTVLPVQLSATYQGSFAVPDVSEHITYTQASGVQAGMAAQGAINLLDQPISSGWLQVHNASHVLIFNTGSSPIQRREKILQQEAFLEMINPTFGYSLDQQHIMAFKLGYDQRIVSRVGDTLGKGVHEISIVNSRQQDQILFVPLDSNRIILSSD